MQWFLVTATNGTGEGSAGSSGGNERSLDSSGDCSTPAPALLINEVDYDQVGTDNGEFVEIVNAGSDPVALADVVLILVNGSNSAEYRRIDLVDAASTLAPGAYLVVAASALQTSLPAGTPFVAFPAATNNMQNGAPDAVALFDTVSSTLLDGLSYEGSIVGAQFDGVPGTWNLVDGAGSAAVDSNTVDGSISRIPDGTDSGDDLTDWIFAPVTPGAANLAPAD